MHYKAVADKPWKRLADISLVVLGFVAMAYTTSLTVVSWMSGPTVKTPGYCDGK